MYAIVHPSCTPHAGVLAKLGYELLTVDHPVKKEDIRGDWLRDHIEGENCCGSAEFIKLYGESLFCVLWILNCCFECFDKHLSSLTCSCSHMALNLMDTQQQQQHKQIILTIQSTQ
jgi:hypothetical protein